MAEAGIAMVFMPASPCARIAGSVIEDGRSVLT
jgi:hypothetical protein